MSCLIFLEIAHAPINQMISHKLTLWHYLRVLSLCVNSPSLLAFFFVFERCLHTTTKEQQKNYFRFSPLFYRFQHVKKGT